MKTQQFYNGGALAEFSPIGFEAGDTNLYRFVGNNPGNWLDPMGLEKYYRIWRHIRRQN